MCKNRRNQNRVNVIKSRQKLLNCIKSIIPEKQEITSIMRLWDYNYNGVYNRYRDLYLQILNNQKRHYLATSQDDSGKVSYCRSDQYKYDSNRRIKTTLQKGWNTSIKD